MKTKRTEGVIVELEFEDGTVMLARVVPGTVKHTEEGVSYQIQILDNNEHTQEQEEVEGN